LNAFSSINKSKEEKEKDTKKLKAQKLDPKTVLKEKIIRGERAILSEIDLIKKKEDRNKLLRFNKPDNESNLIIVNITPIDTSKLEESKMSKKVESKTKPMKESKIKSKINMNSIIIDDKKQSLLDSVCTSSINRDTIESDSDSEEYKNPQIEEKKRDFMKFDQVKKNDKLDIFKKVKLSDE